MLHKTDVATAENSCETSINTFANNIISVAKEIKTDLENQISESDKANIIEWLKTGVIADDNLKKKLDFFLTLKPMTALL